jgi:hypothetical protein
LGHYSTILGYKWKKKTFCYSITQNYFWLLGERLLIYMIVRITCLIVKMHNFAFPQRLRFKSPHWIILWWNLVELWWNQVELQLLIEELYDLQFLCSFYDSGWRVQWETAALLALGSEKKTRFQVRVIKFVPECGST